jgi:AcrR family transcriptional regulator
LSSAGKDTAWRSLPNARDAARGFSSCAVAAKGHTFTGERSRSEAGGEHALSELTQQKVSGLRERNKLDKLRRIKEAASELFVRKGFDDTTTREIALRAGVGLGTIFVYAPTKRDLLFLIVTGDFEDLVERAAGLVRPERPMLENLLSVFRVHYRYHAQQPVLSRLALREMIFYAAGRQAREFLKAREHLLALIRDIVEMAIEQKSIVASEDSATIAEVIFSIFQIEVRRWLAADELNIKRGTTELRRQLLLLINGLAPRSAR